MSYSNLTIKSLISRIQREEYVLPAIQREFVWKQDQIIRLLDSLMRDYPVGAFLFWDVEEDSREKYDFYEVLKDYHERDNRHNKKANIEGKTKLTAILDGQQRITSLYIAFSGSYSEKKKGARVDNPAAYPKKNVYLNLVRQNIDEDKDIEYDFRFLTSSEASLRDDTQLWFLLSDILDPSFNLVQRYTEYLQGYLVTFPGSEGNDKHSRILNILTKLDQIIKQESLAYYEEQAQDIEKVLDIFIRMNSGGTVLTYSDLLLSLATAQWKNLSAREEINALVNEVNKIGNGFKFTKDNVLKSALVITDKSNIKFKAFNFDTETTTRIEELWPRIKESFILAVRLLESFGFDAKTLRANSIIVPLTYYLNRINFPENYIESDKYREDREKVKYFVQLSIIKRIFGGTPDNIILKMREKLQLSKDTFPLENLLEIRETNKSFLVSESDIDLFVEEKYGAYTFVLLAILNPGIDLRYKYHQDHIFPKSIYNNERKLRAIGYNSNEIKDIKENVDSIVNLQLLEELPNKEKSSEYFHKWLRKRFNKDEDLSWFLKRNLISKIYNEHEFIKFYNDRKEIIKSELMRILIR